MEGSPSPTVGSGERFEVTTEMLDRLARGVPARGVRSPDAPRIMERSKELGAEGGES
jgi:hypothetical protein